MSRIGAVRTIVGKTISGVIIKECKKKDPRAQVFLLFDDDTYFEFYSGGDSPGISCANGIDKGGVRKVRNYIPEGPTIIYEAFKEPDDRRKN